MQLLIALISGTVFGLGLSISEMINPARVIGFLDVAGHWDATLLFVMGGALAVTVPLYPLILRRREPLLDQKFFLPTKQNIDTPLILGAAIFGIGWGLGGFCPGPALAALATGSASVLLFVLAMTAGQLIARWLQ
ncbi:MAG TPA: YeeE/YedE family protein [Candidatus Binatia bacterium]